METRRTRIKICGITRVADARRAAELGADAIGLVFHEPSPRHVDPAGAAAIAAALPPFVTVVGLFVDAPHHEVTRVLEQVGLDLLQFHGNEPADYCASFDRPYIKALRVRESVDLAPALGDYPGAAGLLLDAWDPEAAGGTGKSFNWEMIPRETTDRPLILAGGLHAGNVADAIARVAPYGVDVSSGVEEAPGIKSAAQMEAFIRAATAGRD